LSVAAAGTAPLSYQWYQGTSGNTSTPVGINSASFTTPSLTAATDYWVAVRNSCGSVNSHTATISVSAQCSPSDPGPAFSVTALFADAMDSGPIGSRTPLILIHGRHGNNPNYFDNILCYFNNTDFKAKYKAYRFVYEGDQYPVSELARSMRYRLDKLICADQHFDKGFVIVGHSMGGLIARSYMNEQVHTVGAFAGKAGGERVIKLITLGTPHHGTIAANEQSRDQLATNSLWKAVLTVACLFACNTDFNQPTGLIFCGMITISV
jgi:triacylglycerol esterase/lipase EstA (alpha/beta hydrolase family)